MTEHKKKTWFQRYKIPVAALLGVITISLVLGLHSGENCEIVIGNKTIAIAESENAAKKAIAELSAQKSSELNQKVTIDSRLQLKTVKPTANPLKGDQLNNALKDKMDFFIQGAVVKIDSKPQLKFQNQETANEFLKQLKDKYRAGENCDLKFAEKIETTDEEINIRELDTIPKALQYAEKGKSDQIIHTIEENDTLWDIAAANKTSVEKIADLNPGISENLQVGQEIKVNGSAPLIHVLATYEITQEEVMSYNTEYKEDASLGQNVRKTIQEGKNGTKNVTYLVQAQNGKVTEREVTGKEVICEPIPKIIVKGTKFVLTSRGGGGLIWPARGGVSSTFGPRWGRMHNGIDIAAGHGSPVVASGPGTVTRAGWESGYGKTVVVSHGNGIQTKYAHLSSVSVSSGQSVGRGQLVGNVGSTGNSTGPHLHFEVLINGSHQDPLKYL